MTKLRWTIENVWIVPPNKLEDFFRNTFLKEYKQYLKKTTLY